MSEGNQAARSNCSSSPQVVPCSHATVPHIVALLGFSFHAAKIRTIFVTCKFWSSKCRKNLFSLLRRDKIRALAQVFSQFLICFLLLYYASYTAFDSCRWSFPHLCSKLLHGRHPFLPASRYDAHSDRDRSRNMDSC